MTRTEMRILIVADDAELIAVLTQHLVTQLDADVGIVDTVEGALTLAAVDSYDIMLIAQELATPDGLDRLGSDSTTCGMPRILVGGHCDGEQVLAAFRSGVIDLLPVPIDFGRLSTLVRRTVRIQRTKEHEQARAQRLRQLSSRLIRDRRELRKRVDLICRDLVLAYKRLAEKVVAAHPCDREPEPPGQIDSFSPRA